MNSTIIGIDLAKDSFAVARLGFSGAQPGAIEEFPNSEAGCQRLIESLEDPTRTYVVFEATGFCGKLIAQQLDGRVAGIYEVNPQLFKRFATSLTQTKTDSADALSIAKAARTWLQTQPETLERYRVEFDDDRENLALWVSEYRRLSRAISKLKVQIESLSGHVCSEVAVIRQRRRTELRLLQENKKEVKRSIEEKIRTKEAGPDAELLMSIPSIGPLSAAALVVALRNIDRFETADSLKAYLGMYPRRRQTGQREAPSRMANHGNALVRHMLWNAARCAARFNPVCKATFERLRESGKSAPAAYGAVARKLVQIVFGVLRTKTPFSYKLVDG